MGVITVAAVQAAPLPMTGLPVFGQSATLDAFVADTERVRAQIAGPALLVYPELHLFGTDDQPDEHHDQLLQAAAQPLEGEVISQLDVIARSLDAWLIPGSIYERTGFGEIFNTALIFSPTAGSLAPTARSSPGAPTSRPPPETASLPSLSPTSAASVSRCATTPGFQTSAGIWPGWARTL